MTIEWPDVQLSDARVPSRVAATAHAVADALRRSAEALARQGSSGAEHARELTDEMLATSRRAGRSARRIVRDHPAEALLLVGAAAFALGWLARHMRDSAPPPRARASPSTKRASRRAS